MALMTWKLCGIMRLFHRSQEHDVENTMINKTLPCGILWLSICWTLIHGHYTLRTYIIWPSTVETMLTNYFNIKLAHVTNSHVISVFTTKKSSEKTQLMRWRKEKITIIHQGILLAWIERSTMAPIVTYVTAEWHESSLALSVVWWYTAAAVNYSIDSRPFIQH